MCSGAFAFRHVLQPQPLQCCNCSPYAPILHCHPLGRCCSLWDLPAVISASLPIWKHCCPSFSSGREWKSLLSPHHHLCYKAGQPLVPRVTRWPEILPLFLILGPFNLHTAVSNSASRGAKSNASQKPRYKGLFLSHLLPALLTQVTWGQTQGRAGGFSHCPITKGEEGEIMHA